LRVGLHRVLSGFPSGGTDLAVLVGELEGLDESQRFVDGSTDGQIVDRDLSEHALVVDNVEAAEGDSLVLLQTSVSLGDCVGGVGQDGNLHLAQSAFFARLVRPSQVRKARICGSGDDGAVALGKGRSRLRECDDLCRTDKSEVEWVEEQHHILALVVTEFDGFEFAADERLTGEIGRWFSNLSASR